MTTQRQATVVLKAVAGKSPRQAGAAAIRAAVDPVLYEHPLSTGFRNELRAQFLAIADSIENAITYAPVEAPPMADFVWPKFPPDGTFFQPGERWRSPRGCYYIVDWSSRITERAALRRLLGPPGSALHNETTGRLRHVPWDYVRGWTRIQEAPANGN